MSAFLVMAGVGVMVLGIFKNFGRQIQKINWNVGMMEHWNNGFWGIDGMVYLSRASRSCDWENQVDKA